MTSNSQPHSLVCPFPIQRYPNVTLAHGGGGTLMRQLIEQMFLETFGSDISESHDGAYCDLHGFDRIAFTTDSYVIRPLFFPGGDIGSLAVHGTVNDLAMCGASPLWVSVGFILEEGLPMETLWKIVRSMKKAADQSQVSIVTGDTKVVDRGKGDGIYINTSGIGRIETPRPIEPAAIRPGDSVLVSGDLGRHGIAVMASREGLEFETTLESDSAPLAEIVLNLLDQGVEIHCLRDLTRGGLTSALNELALASNLSLRLRETSIPLHPQVRGVCEVLGLDPLSVANEGRFVAVVPAAEAGRTLDLLSAHAEGRGAAIIGEVTEEEGGLVTLETKIGARRILSMTSGEQLPRIC